MPSTKVGTSHMNPNCIELKEEEKARYYNLEIKKLELLKCSSSNQMQKTKAR